jgi:serine/threonine-protein kinase
MSEKTLATDNLIGTLLDNRFRVDSLLSRGGLSVLYKGVDDTNDEPIIIRILLDRRSEDDQSINRFNNAVKLAGNLRHPNIVPILGSGVTESGAPYLVLRYVEARSVRDRVEKEGPLKFEDALPIIRDIGAALQYAHEQDVVHRNLKPSNILLTTVDGKARALLTGFGIAKRSPGKDANKNSLAQTTKVVGSPLYMSPEQFINSKIDARSDIYSFGCVIHQMLSGRPPFDAPNLVQLMSAHHQSYRQHLKPDSQLNVPAFVDEILDAATFKLPANRYYSVKDMVADLDAGKCSIDLRQARHREPETKDSSANRQATVKAMAIITACGVLLVAVIIFIAGFDSLFRKSPEKTVAAPAPTAVSLNSLLSSGQYGEATAILKNELQIESTGDRPVFRLYEKLGALGLLSENPELARMYYRKAIELRGQSATHGTNHNAASVREDWACIGITYMPNEPNVAQAIVEKNIAPHRGTAMPSAYLIYQLAAWNENGGKDEAAAKLWKLYPVLPGFENPRRRMEKQDLDEYLINVVKEPAR